MSLRYYFLVYFLCLIVFEGGAQHAFVNAGLNFNQSSVKELETDNRLSTGVNTGFSDFVFGAGFATRRFYDKFDFKLGLEWTVKGYRDKFTEHAWLMNSNFGLIKDNYKIRTKLNYLNVPLLVNYYFNIKENIFFAQAGGFTSLGVIGTEQISGEYVTGEKFEKGILTEVFIVKEQRGIYRGDNGLTFGFGAEWDDFQFGIQYHHSLKNISRQDFDIRNRTICLYALINFDLSK